MLIKFFKNNTKLSRLIKSVESTIVDLRARFSEKIYGIALANVILVLLQTAYLALRFKFINDVVPFWYTETWGDPQLASKKYLLLLPATSVIITVLGLALTIPVKKYYLRYGMDILGLVTIFSNLLLTYSLLRVIFRASVPFAPLIAPLYMDLVIPGIIGFLVVLFVLPKFIAFAHDKNIVTNPQLHFHPGMLLQKPTARGGGFVYGLLFFILAVFFVGIPGYLAVFYVSLLLISLLGFLDDYQNTHPKSVFGFLENPYVRLFLLFSIVSIISTIGTKIFSVHIPFTGVISLNSYFLSSVVTAVWIVWVLNGLSWSNGIDGQYCGIVGIASLVILLLALRFETPLPMHRDAAILAAISAGLSFGFTKFTWHPSKILWGFGAMSAGLVLAVLSILISSKVITSVIVILIPFLDAFVIVIRRLWQGRNPLKGDKGHLHHILLNRGWSVRRVALFYWASTAFFGILALLTAEKYTLHVGLTLVGIVAFGIALLNVRFGRDVQNS